MDGVTDSGSAAVENNTENEATVQPQTDNKEAVTSSVLETKSDDSPANDEEKKSDVGSLSLNSANGDGENITVIDPKGDEQFSIEIKNEITSLTEGFKVGDLHDRHIKNSKLARQSFEKVEELSTDCESADDSENCDTKKSFPLPDAPKEEADESFNEVPSRKCESSGKSLKKGKQKTKHKSSRQIDKTDTESENSDDSNCAGFANANPSSTQKNFTPASSSQSKPKRKKSKRPVKKNASNSKFILENTLEEETQSPLLLEGSNKTGEETDVEDNTYSGEEEEFDPIPVQKAVHFQIPVIEQEITKEECSAQVEVPNEEVDTDEEGFEIGFDEDMTPLPRILITLSDAKEDTDDEEEDDAQVSTDDDDVQVEEEEVKILENELQSWVNAAETNVLETMEHNSGSEQTIKIWQSVVSRIITMKSTLGGMTPCQVSNQLDDSETSDDGDGATTSEENCNSEEETVIDSVKNVPDKGSKPNKYELSDIENIDLESSDNEGSVISITDKNIDSQLRFHTTEKGDILTLCRNDSYSSVELNEDIPGIVFVQQTEQPRTDVEDVYNSEVESLVIETENLVNKEDINVQKQVKIEKVTRGGLSAEPDHDDRPITDTEDFDITLEEVIGSSSHMPEADAIVIQDDEEVKQKVEVETVNQGMLFVDNENDDRPVTDTEDFDINLEDALKMFSTSKPHPEFSLQELYCANSETSDKVCNKVSNGDLREPVASVRNDQEGESHPKMLCNPKGDSTLDTDEEMLGAATKDGFSENPQLVTDELQVSPNVDAGNTDIESIGSIDLHRD